MKKLISIVVALALMAGLLSACSKPKESKPQEQKPSATEENKKPTSSDTTSATTEKDDFKGIWDRTTISSAQGLVHVDFKWPLAKGERAHTGIVAQQSDKTLILVDNYNPTSSPKVDSLENVFPAYFEQTAKVFEVYFRGEYSDGSFTLDSKEEVKIGNREFLKLTGKHTYKYDGNDREKAYIIYLTEMANPGAYIYWLVSDMSADQSAGAKMAEHAYNIASSAKLAKN